VVTVYLKPCWLLLISNRFMTDAWYDHVKDLRAKPLWLAVAASWGVAFLESSFQVPAKRMGRRIFDGRRLFCFSRRSNSTGMRTSK
jgi:uncharacterized protein (DUF486 family)